jgi:UDP-GlcNAc3NAcA epimerase
VSSAVPRRVLTVVGARPQFIKAAPWCRALQAAGHEGVLLHTGQHYDAALSDQFFAECGLPLPDVHLHSGSGTHAEQTARIMIGVEAELLRRRPDVVVLFGDTNSTIAGSLAAAKVLVPVAHVEAGLRSFDRSMPEEINRVVTDHLSALLWAPGQTAVDNLAREGLTAGVELVGDIMVDALQDTLRRVSPVDVLGQWSLHERGYLVATIHRAANTAAGPLRMLVQALGRLSETVVWPMHPRTQDQLAHLGVALPANVLAVAPLGHREMVALVRHARMVLTDSGGLQKEAYWLRVPCITLRDATEWVETVTAGWNILVGSDVDKIVDAVTTFTPAEGYPVLYGDGQTASRCVASLERACEQWART